MSDRSIQQRYRLLAATVVPWHFRPDLAKGDGRAPLMVARPSRDRKALGETQTR